MSEASSEWITTFSVERVRYLMDWNVGGERVDDEQSNSQTVDMSTQGCLIS